MEIRGEYIPHLSAAVTPPARSQIGTRVTPDQALSMAAVYRAISVISTSISQLPIIAYRDGQPIESKLCERPDIERTAEQFLTEVVHSLALHGNAYLWKSENDAGQVINLTCLKPERVSVVQEDRGPIPRVLYYLDINSDSPVNNRIIHLRLNTRPGEPMGFGPIQSAGPDIASALKIRAYGDAYFDVGEPVGVLSTDQTINQAQADSYRDAFSEVMSQRSVAVLGSGMDYKSIWQDPQQTQFTDVQLANVTMVARLFGIPIQYMAAGVEGTSLTYSNTESLQLTFLQTCLAQYLTPIEQAITEALPRGQNARLKLDALLRADLSTRTTAYQTLHAMGVVSADEIRASEGMAGPAPGSEENNQPNDNHLQDDGAPV